MSTIRGSNVNPSATFESELARKELNKKQRKDAREKLEEAYRKWKKWLDTESGKAARELASPKIQYCSYLLSLSSEEFVQVTGVPAGGVNEKRAEIRGERRVWVGILREPEYLLGMVKELSGEEKEETGGWKTPPKKKES